MIDTDTVAEVMGSVAFVCIAGFAGLCLAIPVASLFAEVNASNFWPYAAVGFVFGAPFGFVGYRLRERFLDRTLEVQ